MKGAWRSIIAMSVALLITAAGLWAEEGEGRERGAQKAPASKEALYEAGEIVVTATKSEIDYRETGASITVITAKEMEQRGKKQVADALRDVPGMMVAQTGQFGMSSLVMRGSKSRHVLVLVDGVKLNDPSSPDGSLNLTNLLTDNVDRIEVLRGSYSTLYGSYATGGVVNIITKRGSGGLAGSINFEGGSYQTYRESVSLSEGDDTSYFSMAVSRTDSKGISSAAKAPGAVDEPERDGYGNLTLSTRVGYRVLESAWLSFSSRYYDSESDIDDDAYDDDRNNTLSTRQLTSVLAFEHRIASFWSHRLSVYYMNMERHNNDRLDPVDGPLFGDSRYHGMHRKAEWQHMFSLGTFDDITIGGEIEQDAMESLSYGDLWGMGTSTTAFDETGVITKSLYAQNRLKILNRIFLTAGVRRTDHETFGEHLDYQFSGSIALPFTETRFRGNYSTGFHAPTIFQLYDPAYGNKELDPEESVSWDAGVEQPVWGNRLVVDVAYFEVEYDNLIGPEGMKTVNKGRFRTSGVESSMKFAPARWFSVDAHYTYIREAEDVLTGERSIRNPEHQGGANVNLSILDRGNVNFGINYIGKRKDSWFDSAWVEHKIDAEYYTLMHLVGSFEVYRGFVVHGRVENLENRKYENPVGYKSPERSYYGGLKIIL